MEQLDVISKQRNHETQKMDAFVKSQGLNHLAIAILIYLDDKSLVQCRQIKKSWKALIDNQKFFYIRQLQKLVENNQLFFTFKNRQWFQIVDGISRLRRLYKLTMIKNMTKLLTQFFKAKSSYVHLYSPMEWIVSKNQAIWIKFALKYVTDLDHKNLRNDYTETRTALMTAVKAGYVNIVKLILQNCQGKSISFDVIDRNGFTPFINACNRGQLEIVKLFLQYADEYNIDLNDADYDNRNGFIHAVMCKNFDITELLLQDKRIDVSSPDETTQTPWMWVCENGYLGNVQAFIKHANTRNLHFNYRGSNGQTGFIYACASGFDMAVYLILQNLNTLGIDVNIADNRGRTALIWASIRGQARVVDLLLTDYKQLKINPNHVDENGMTALMYACKEKESFVLDSFFRKATFAGIDFQVKDTKFQRTAYIWGCIHARKGDAIHDEFDHYSQKLSIDLTARDYKGRTGADYLRLTKETGEFYSETKQDLKLEKIRELVANYWMGIFEDPFEEKIDSSSSEDSSESESETEAESETTESQNDESTDTEDSQEEDEPNAKMKVKLDNLQKQLNDLILLVKNKK